MEIEVEGNNVVVNIDGDGEKKNLLIGISYGIQEK